MSLFRTAPIMAAALALAGAELLASAPPEAKSAALQGPTTPILDNFNRPNEDPLTCVAARNHRRGGVFVLDLSSFR